MKTSIKLTCLTATMTLGAGLLLAQEAPQPPTGPSTPQPPPHSPMMMGRFLLDTLDRYDANRDDRLDSTEMARLRTDAKSGQLLPPSHRPGGAQAQEAPFGPGARGEMIRHYGPNEERRVDRPERTIREQSLHSGEMRAEGFAPQKRPAPAEILERFDADENGSLDAAELEMFLKTAPRRPPMHAGMAPPHEHGPREQ